MPEDDDAIARRYHSMAIEGKLRAAVRWATSRSGGGMLALSDIDAKTGKPVIDVLQDKPPECRTPAVEREGWASFEDYPPPRDGTPLDCDQETIQEVATKLRGGAGPSSVDGQALGHWLLRLFATSWTVSWSQSRGVPSLGGR